MSLFKKITSALGGNILGKATELIDSLVTSEEERKELKIKLKKVVLDHEATMHSLAHQNTASARDLQQAALAQDDRFSKRFIYYLAAFWSFAGVLYIFLITFSEVLNDRIADTVLGFLMGTIVSTIVSTIINYFYGSAAPSGNPNPAPDPVRSLLKNEDTLNKDEEALPNVSITIEGGRLGRVPALSDGEAGLLITGKLSAAPAAADENTALQNAYLRPVQIGSPKDLDALSISAGSTDAAQVAIRKQVKDFYKGAGEGGRLWLMLLPTGSTSTFEKVFEVGGAAEKMVHTSGGRVHLLGIAHRSTTKTSAVDGLKYGLHEAVTQGQAFALRQQATASPLSILVGGENLRTYKQQIRSSDGAAERMAQTMSGHLVGSWKELSSAVQEASLRLFEQRWMCFVNKDFRSIIYNICSKLSLLLPCKYYVPVTFGNLTDDC